MRSLEPLSVSALARVEVPAAIWRKHRVGEVTVEEAAALVGDFESDFYGVDAAARFAAALVTVTLLEDAARLTAQGLRAYDALQLASAVRARAADPELVSFACFDVSLRRAAAKVGFSLIPSHVGG
ncbi:MAG: type II toxin-antitoxin system VapC family toxin [Thermoleophilaceae bacterium]|nr:type II toxin-antitoxin system VapC family toxin [Actinomycetota bacterium]